MARPAGSARATADQHGAPGGVLTSRDAPSFDVHLDVFTGPFDLLLGLIAKHRLDITEVALADVTDEFIAHVRRLRTQPASGGPSPAPDGDPLGQLSGFLLVAATLLDLKAARLLPAGEVEDVEDLALLEARDLLFARLLQHRAYARVAALLGAAMAEEALHVPRAAPLDEHLVAALPELLWATTPRQLADLAAAALAPKPGPPTVSTEHLHAPAVSVSEQVGLLTAILRATGGVSFAVLIADAGGPAVVVGRFLAVLEMYRRGWVDLDQDVPLGPLDVRWVEHGVNGVEAEQHA